MCASRKPGSDQRSATEADVRQHFRPQCPALAEAASAPAITPTSSSCHNRRAAAPRRRSARHRPRGRRAGLRVGAVAVDRQLVDQMAAARMDDDVVRLQELDPVLHRPRPLGRSRDGAEAVVLQVVAQLLVIAPSTAPRGYVAPNAVVETTPRQRTSTERERSRRFPANPMRSGRPKPVVSTGTSKRT
jgi:hypothetical protein